MQHPYPRLRMAMASAQGTSSACAACRVLRRKCTAQCLFTPYFRPDQPQKFAHVHKGVDRCLASQMSPRCCTNCHLRTVKTVNSLAYEADARVQDPVYGCVGSISVLQQQVTHLQAQLALATSEITRLRETFAIAAAASSTSTSHGAAASAAAPGARLVAALLPRSSPSTHAADNSTSSAEVNPDIATSPQPRPQQQQAASACTMPEQQARSPTPCECSPPELLQL